MSKQDAPLTAERMEDKGVRFVPKEGDPHDGRLSLTAGNLSSNWIYKGQWHIKWIRNLELV